MSPRGQQVSRSVGRSERASEDLQGPAFEGGNGRVGFACIRSALRKASEQANAREASEPPCLEPLALLVRF